MAIGLPGARVFGEVTRASVLNTGRELGVPLKAAERILAEVLARVPIALAREVHELEQRRAAQTAGIKPHLAIEARFMRVLTSIIAKDMLGRLQR